MIEDLLEMQRARRQAFAGKRKRRSGDALSRADLAHLAGILSAAVSALGREDIGVGPLWASPGSVLVTLAKGGAREICEIPLHVLRERSRVLASLSAGIVRLNRRRLPPAVESDEAASTPKRPTSA